MTDSTPSQSSKVLVGVLAACLIIVAVVAGYFIVKSNQQIAASQDQVASLTSQLEDSEKQIAELQPLANKARTLPVTYRIDRHALNAGYNLFTFNRSRDSLRFTFTVNGGRTFNAVIDGGRFWVLRGLATGDSVVIASEGFDPKTVAIQ